MDQQTTQQQHQLQNQNQQPPQNDQDNNSSGGAKGSFLCRQSSTRWTPTTDQIRILKELYYTNGLRSPNAEQIQRISARLRQYGKIEGKNVFYWFQNHKARERQKKRLTNDVSMQHHRNVSNISPAAWKPEDYSIHNKYSNFSTPGGFSSACPSSSGGFNSGQINGNYGYGSLTMEKSFRDCSISPSGTNNCFGGSISHNYGGVTINDQYGSPYTISFDRRKINSIPTLEDYDEDQQEEDEGVQAVAEIETLPLFPVHREDINAFCGFKQNSGNCYFRNWYGSDDHGNGLELSLKSYTGQSQDFI